MVAQPCLRKGSMRLRSALMGTMRRGSCSSNSGIRRSAYRYVINKRTLLAGDNKLSAALRKMQQTSMPGIS